MMGLPVMVVAMTRKKKVCWSLASQGNPVGSVASLLEVPSQ